MLQIKYLVKCLNLCAIKLLIFGRFSRFNCQPGWFGERKDTLKNSVHLQHQHANHDMRKKANGKTWCRHSSYDSCRVCTLQQFHRYWISLDPLHHVSNDDELPEIYIGWFSNLSGTSYIIWFVSQKRRRGGGISLWLDPWQHCVLGWFVILHASWPCEDGTATYSAQISHRSDNFRRKCYTNERIYPAKLGHPV